MWWGVAPRAFHKQVMPLTEFFPVSLWDFITILTCVHLKQIVCHSVAQAFLNTCSDCTVCFLCTVSTDATFLGGVNTSLMKWQYVITDLIRQSEIPALLDSGVTSIPSVKMFCPQKNCLSLYFCKNITCLIVGLLRIGHVFCVSCEIVYQWVTTNCCFLSNMQTHYPFGAE
jgi:hypothetical protein